MFFDEPGTFGRLHCPADRRQGDGSPNKTWTPDGSPIPALTTATWRCSGCAAWRPARRTTRRPAQAFDQPFRKTRRPRSTRQTYDAQAFDAYILCYLAAVAAGSTNGGKMADQLREVSGPPGHEVHLAAAARGGQGAPEGRGHRLRGRLGPDRPRTPRATRPPAPTTRTSSRRSSGSTCIGDVAVPPGRSRTWTPLKSKQNRSARRARDRPPIAPPQRGR